MSCEVWSTSRSTVPQEGLVRAGDSSSTPRTALPGLLVTRPESFMSVGKHFFSPRLALLCCEFRCSDLALSKMASLMRLTEPGDDVVVYGCEAKENFKPTEKRSNLRLESSALPSIER